MADELDADLTLLHVASARESERGLEQRLLDVQSRLRSRARPPLWRVGRTPATVIRAGNPVRAVAAEISEGTRPDLLVLGRHRRRLLQDALEGSIAANALAKRICPVLMVHNRAAARYSRVLLALDASPASGMAVRTAEQLVLAGESTAKVVHAVDPPYTGMLSYASVTTRERRTLCTGVASRKDACHSRSSAAREWRCGPVQPPHRVRTCRARDPECRRRFSSGSRGDGYARRWPVASRNAWQCGQRRGSETRGISNFGGRRRGATSPPGPARGVDIDPRDAGTGALVAQPAHQDNPIAGNPRVFGRPGLQCLSPICSEYSCIGSECDELKSNGG